MTTPHGPVADTPAPVRALAQTDDGDATEAAAAGGAGGAVPFTISIHVARAVGGRPYHRQPHDPLYRPLRIFTLDPTQPRREGAIALVRIPYEPLGPDFEGSVFRVDARDHVTGRRLRSLDLDHPHVLIESGRAPSPNDPLFHQQMVYAVASLVYATFRTALGRDLAWGFGAPGDEPTRLLLQPFAFDGGNAEYDRASGSIRFGYYRAEHVTGPNLPRGFVYTALSHDVVAHEVTHALLDGLRPNFRHASGLQSLALHEGFADLVAIFQHFSYEQVVRAAIRRSRGRMDLGGPLSDLATQVGQTTGRESALRSAVGPDPPTYHDDLEPHEMGSVLVSAIFAAFVRVYRAKTAAYVRLATQGTGVLPEGELPADLLDVLAARASALASQFMNICIRAIDYCPPVDPELGNYLRALITADHDLVPDDPWAYREALIDAFRSRGIHPRSVPNLAEDALLWALPRRYVPPCPELAFGRLQFDGDPARPASATELERQARAVGALVTDPLYRAEFGLAAPGALGGDVIEPPRVESVRTSRRVGPDGQVAFDLIAEVVQRRRVAAAEGAPAFDFLGGATLIVGPDGTLRYVVSKNVLSERRLEEQRAFVRSHGGISPQDLSLSPARARPDE